MNKQELIEFLFDPELDVGVKVEVLPSALEPYRRAFGHKYNSPELGVIVDMEIHFNTIEYVVVHGGFRTFSLRKTDLRKLNVGVA